ncbi:MAG TPA: DUF192 domain-containing protein [Thermoanaerobaculia bacterium]|nr:DUF192 domain-containing protein [Thermoanaerobaculia bacterium]
MRSSLAVILLAAMCSQPASAPPKEIPLPRVTFPDGYAVHIELATDDQTRALGLMFRDQVRPESGMLFIFPEPAPHSFWMKNTLIPLDMIFIDEASRVVHIEHDVPPCKADPCPGYPPNGVMSKYVLEVAGGVARQHRLGPGAVLRMEGLENVVVR